MDLDEFRRRASEGITAEGEKAKADKEQFEAQRKEFDRLRAEAAVAKMKPPQPREVDCQRCQGRGFRLRDSGHKVVCDVCIGTGKVTMFMGVDLAFAPPADDCRRCCKCSGSGDIMVKDGLNRFPVKVKCDDCEGTGTIMKPAKFVPQKDSISEADSEADFDPLDPSLLVNVFGGEADRDKCAASHKWFAGGIGNGICDICGYVVYVAPVSWAMCEACRGHGKHNHKSISEPIPCSACNGSGRTPPTRPFCGKCEGTGMVKAEGWETVFGDHFPCKACKGSGFAT